jgi:predicted DNA-binding protein
MTEQITVTLPTAVFQRAQVLAARAGRPVNDLLAETIELSLQPLGVEEEDRPLEAWSDEEVLAGAGAEMPQNLDNRLSELLHRQQAGTLTDVERPELQGLMEYYQRGLLRKAQTLREAVRRGLMEPLQP